MEKIVIVDWAIEDSKIEIEENIYTEEGEV